MSKPRLKTSSVVTKKPVKTAVDRMQELYANGKYTYALRLLHRIARDGALEHWRSVFLINTGQFEEAQEAIQKALAHGYAGRIASLAVLHRLTRTNRDWLLSLKAREVEALNSFDRALLEREIGNEHLQRQNTEAARLWLERSWRTATNDQNGSSLLPGIGEALSFVLRLVGRHAQAIGVFDEALRHANVSRRAPLLLSRAISHIVLQQFERAENDLMDAKTFVPTLATDPSLQARVALTEGRLLHARGQLEQALTHFERAAELGHDANHETEFTAYLWAFTTTIELNRFQTISLNAPTNPNDPATRTQWGADMYQICVRDFTKTPKNRYQKAWFELRSALLEARQPTPKAIEREEFNARALVRTATALELFEKIGARWEIGAIWLLRAEISLAASFSSDHHPENALEQALKVARALGGTKQYTTEVRALTRLVAYLERDDTPKHFKEFLNAVQPHTVITVYPDRLYVNGESSYKSSNAARLLRYVALNPRSVWRDLARDVYPALEDKAARQEFAVNRRELLEIGVSLEFDASSNAYGAVWGAVVLEVLDDPQPLHN
jgi:tetratricopeptide (TPR) repeat protein